MRKLFISLCFSACCSLLAAQTTNPIQEAMANYDYETALMLIDQETPTVPLLYQKGKALKGLGRISKCGCQHIFMYRIRICNTANLYPDILLFSNRFIKFINQIV